MYVPPPHPSPHSPLSLPGRGRGRRGPPFQGPMGPPQKGGGRGVRSELKSREQILKQRKKQQKQTFLQSGGLKKLRGKSKQRLNEMKKSGFGRGAHKKGKKLWGREGGREEWEEDEMERDQWGKMWWKLAEMDF